MKEFPKKENRPLIQIQYKWEFAEFAKNLYGVPTTMYTLCVCIDMYTYTLCI